MAINTDHTTDTISASSGTVTIAGSVTVPNNSISNAELAQVATATLKGRTTAGTGNVEDLTATQATALLDTFTSGAKGLAPASGGGTTNFLRADGTWAAPAAGGLSDGDKGDITVSASGTVWEIDPGAIVNADVNASAAIAGSKIFPDFGSQNVTTTGTITGRLTPPAGAAAAGNAPFKLTSGTSLTVAEAGAIEYDGTFIYATPTTDSGRGHLGPQQTFRLTANGANIGPAIGDYFGTTSSINLTAASVFEIFYYVHLQKITAGTLTWTLTASSAPTIISGVYRGSPVTGVAAGAPITGYAGSRGAATAAFAATASVSNNAFMTFEIRAQVTTNLATNFRLRVTNSAGTVTPQAGSFYTVRRISTNAGSFA